ncbi:type II toxin-antitoxin system death-on-curing family toxin [Mycobacterium sp. BMJ-28]
MTAYLDLEDLIEIARRTLGDDVAVRDYGLLDAALARPRAWVFGEDAYPDLFFKAAALMQSLARNPALIDGNKRLAWAACLTFLGVNGQWITAPEDARFEFVIRVSTGADSELTALAGRLRAWSHPER